MQNWRTFEERAALAARAFKVWKSFRNKVVLPLKRVLCFDCFMKSTYRQQPSPLLYSIDIWPAQNSMNKSLYTSLCKPVSLVIPCWMLAQTISNRPFCTASAICCMLSIVKCLIPQHILGFFYYLVFLVFISGSFFCSANQQDTSYVRFSL